MACSKTNTRIDHTVCIVSEDVVQHFNKNAELETIFGVNSFSKMNHAQCNLSKCTTKVVALPYSNKCLLILLYNKLSVLIKVVGKLSAQVFPVNALHCTAGFLLE